MQSIQPNPSDPLIQELSKLRQAVDKMRSRLTWVIGISIFILAFVIATSADGSF